MRFGLCTISNKHVDVMTVLEHAAVAGYDGVEVWGQDHIGDGSRETCVDIQKTATDLDLDIPVYGSYLRLGTEHFADDLEHEVAVADRLDADLIRVWAGSQEYDDHDKTHWNQTVSDLHDLVNVAADRSIEVTVEKHANSLTNVCEGARRLIDDIDDPACGLNYQPMFSLSPKEIRSEANELAALSNHVHLQAVPEQESSSRCALSNAFFDVSAILDTVIEAGFDGYVNVEFVRDDVPYAMAIADDLAYLRSLTK